MTRIATATLLLLGLAACTTPTTTLQNPKTGQVTTCGGSSGASWAGGAIGYHIQKGNDEDCVNNYKSQGFAVTGVKD